MSENVQIAVYSDGNLGVYGAHEKNGEAMLALPLSRLIVKTVRIPSNLEMPAEEFAKSILQAMSPYPDEDLTVSLEVVREEPDATIFLAAALPESSAEDIAEALDAAKLNIRRVDILALGKVRELWPSIGGDGRRLVLLDEKDDVALLVLDGDMPVAIRALSKTDDFKRDISLALLEAEDFGGEKPLHEIVAIGEVETDGLDSFAPVRKLDDAPSGEIPADALAERSFEGDTINALPASWSEVLEETRFKAKMKLALGCAMAVWTLAMATLFGVPAVYGFMTDRQKSLSKAHAKKYTEVKEMKAKVDLVKKYSDHSLGALEILKAVSDRLPEGVELNSWNFRRDDGVKFSGEAVEPKSVYAFKEAVADTKVFSEVLLSGPSAGKAGKQKFDIVCKFPSEEE